MNPYTYINPLFLIEELKKINKHLSKIEEYVLKEQKIEDNNYLEKDDNYYII